MKKYQYPFVNVLLFLIYVLGFFTYSVYDKVSQGETYDDNLFKKDIQDAFLMGVVMSITFILLDYFRNKRISDK